MMINKISHYAFFTALLFMSPLLAEPIVIKDTGVSFSPPEGFKALDDTVVEKRWTNKKPDFAIGKPSGSPSISYTLADNPLPQDAMAPAKFLFSRLFEQQIEGLNWVKNDVIDLAGQKWIHLEMISTKAQIHNSVLITGVGEKTFVLNFNASVSEFAEIEGQFKEWIKTIKIKKA